MNNFLENQKHPEAEETACVRANEAAKLLTPAVDLEVNAAGGIWQNGSYYLFVSPKNRDRSICCYTGAKIDNFGNEKQFAELELPVTAIACFENGGTPGVCVCAGEVYIFDLKGTLIGRPGIIAKYASLILHNDEPYLVYDGKLRRLKKALDGFDGEATEIRARPFRINGARYDKLFEENRTRPAKKGGFLFCHRGRFYYFCSEIFKRCAFDYSDAFCCVSDDLKGNFSRRYLVIPSGGIPNVFHGEDGNLYAVFTGSDTQSPVYNKSAVIALFDIDDEFLVPDSAYIYDKGPVSRLHTVKEIRGIRDSFVFNSPDGYYYITGTTKDEKGDHWKGTNGVQIWRSRDLENFENIGKVFDYRENPAGWQNNVSGGLNCWAPEIIFYDNTFWITYSTAPGCGLLKSAGGKIEGPYLDMGRVVNRGIDSGFFLEDDTLYLIWQNGRIAPFSRDGRSMTDEPTLLLPEDGQEAGYEGAGLIKVAGKYVLYAAEWNGDTRIDGTYDMMYSVADNLYGPYRRREILVPHGGHGCLFFDKRGRLCYTIFGNDRTAPFRKGVGIGQIHIKIIDDELILSV
jgi:hypothetical protein